MDNFYNSRSNSQDEPFASRRKSRTPSSSSSSLRHTSGDEEGIVYKLPPKRGSASPTSSHGQDSYGPPPTQRKRDRRLYHLEEVDLSSSGLNLDKRRRPSWQHESVRDHREERHDAVDGSRAWNDVRGGVKHEHRDYGKSASASPSSSIDGQGQRRARGAEGSRALGRKSDLLQEDLRRPTPRDERRFSGPREGHDRTQPRRSSPIEDPTLDLERRRRRDPRLAHKIYDETHKFGTSSGVQALPRSRTEGAPASRNTMPPHLHEQQVQPVGRNASNEPVSLTRSRSRERSHQRTLSRSSPPDSSTAAQALPPKVKAPTSARATPGLAAVSPRPSSGSSSSAPADPRKRRNRTSSRAGGVAHSTGTIAAAPAAATVAPSVSKFTGEAKEIESVPGKSVVGADDAKAGPMLKDCALTGGPDGGSASATLRSEPVDDKQNIVPKDSADPREGGPGPKDEMRAPKHVQEKVVHHRRVDRDGSARWEEEVIGVGSASGVSIVGVTLGGRRAAAPPPPRDDREDHSFHLPLPRQHVPLHQDLPRTASPPPSQRLDPRRDPRPFHPDRLHAHENPRRTRDAPRDHFPGKSEISPPLPLGRGPWQDRQHSGDVFHGGKSERGGEGGGTLAFQRRFPPMRQGPPNQGPPTRMGPSPDDFPQGSNGNQRRSPYAQAMHNKRFVGSANGEWRGGPGMVDGPGLHRGRPPRMEMGFDRPQRLPPPRDDFQRFPRRDYDHPPNLAFGGDDFGYNGGFSGADSNGSVGRREGSGWGSLNAGDEDDEEYPFEHTSPEWTPGTALNSRTAVGQGHSPKAGPNGSGGDHEGGENVENKKEGVLNAGETETTGLQMKGKNKSGSAKAQSDPPPTQSYPSIPSPEKGQKSPTSDADRSTTGRRQLDATPLPEGVGGNAAASGNDLCNKPAKIAAGSYEPASKRSTGVHRMQRLEPAPLSKAAWTVGDLTARFPRLAVPDSLTHVVASWTALDTRAIGVFPMLCQPVADRQAEGKRTEPDGSEEEGSGNGERRQTKDMEGMAPAGTGGDGAGSNREHVWEARVLIPFGIDSKKAAVGRWAEAFRLVLSPQAASPSEKQGSTSSAGDDGHETYSTGSVEANEPSGGTSMTLPGGVWDAELDNGNPEVDDGAALINTVIRACKSAGVDLTRCSSWLKFYEVHEENRTTVAFLCGGGVQAFEGSKGNLHVATIAELIQERASSDDSESGGGESKRRRMNATFEAKLGAEFLWGLVSRDWAGVVLDFLRSLQAAASDKGAEGRGKASIDRGAEFCQSGMKICKASLEGIASMIETPAEIRAAFGLYDLDGKGWVAGDRLEACLMEAGFTLSRRYLKSLTRKLCRVAEDGKRALFHYKKWFPAEEGVVGEGTGDGGKDTGKGGEDIGRVEEDMGEAGEHTGQVEEKTKSVPSELSPSAEKTTAGARATSAQG